MSCETKSGTYQIGTTTQHYPTVIFFDALGQGWRMECHCGDQTCPCSTIEEAGAEMDQHLREATR